VPTHAEKYIVTLLSKLPWKGSAKITNPDVEQLTELCAPFRRRYAPLTLPDAENDPVVAVDAELIIIEVN
jgi:hypothetical protein